VQHLIQLHPLIHGILGIYYIFFEQERQEKRIRLEAEREEKLRAKEEERLKKEAEKKQKEEERKKKEEERLKKLEEEKAKKEEERLKREEEKAKKEEERRKREEEKAKKEEERKQKEEERKQKEAKKEEERRKKQEEKELELKKLEAKKAKQAAQFTKFFQKGSPSRKSTTLLIPEIQKEKENVQNMEISDTNSGCVTPDSRSLDGTVKHKLTFQPFEVKTGMAVAPIWRRPPLSKDDQTVINSCLETQRDKSELNVSYLMEIKRRKGRTSARTEVHYESDVQIVSEDNPKESGLIKWKWKLLQFHDNRRPAYWGTWKRISKRVNSRRPFDREEVSIKFAYIQNCPVHFCSHFFKFQELDYDFDSDDEWEDEPEDAEDLEKMDNEDDGADEGCDGEPEDEDDEEGWMVPHGYLSDSERDDGEHVDKDMLKNSEKEFFSSLKDKMKVHKGSFLFFRA